MDRLIQEVENWRQSLPLNRDVNNKSSELERILNWSMVTELKKNWYASNNENHGSSRVLQLTK